MKTIFLSLVLLILIPITIESFAERSQEYTEAKIEWSEHNFGIINGTGTAKIILTDFDVPNIPTYIDTIEVFVYSDSSPEGITLLLYETEKNSSVFERIFSFSDTRSAPSVLYAREGDTAIVTYTDSTLPLDHVFSEINIQETTLIGLLGYPLERVPASNARIMSLDGHTANFPSTGEQILLMSDITNEQDREQKFVWIAQITNEENRVMALSWIDGTLNPYLSFNPSTSWIPQKEGNYSVVFFVWESLTNPTALSPPIEIEFTVLEEPLESNFSQIKGHVTSENIDKRLDATKKFIDSNTFDHATILHTDIDYLSKHVVVTIANEDFTRGTTAEYYEEKLEDWIPFETRILVASIGQPELIHNEDGTTSNNTNPYTLYDFSGFKRLYKVGEPISFTETVYGFGNPCVFPRYEILDGNTLEPVWEYKIVYPCPFIKDPKQFKITNIVPNDKVESPVFN